VDGRASASPTRFYVACNCCQGVWNFPLFSSCRTINLMVLICSLFCRSSSERKLFYRHEIQYLRSHRSVLTSGSMLSVNLKSKRFTLCLKCNSTNLPCKVCFTKHCLPGFLRLDGILVIVTIACRCVRSCLFPN
jgi:hypothetical protein